MVDSQLGSRDSTLLSTWSKQKDLPQLNPELRETTWLIGDYEIHKKLGEGEFASVYECSKEGASARVAVKAIKKAKVQRHTSIYKSRRNIGRVNAEVAALKKAVSEAKKHKRRKMPRGRFAMSWRPCETTCLS